MRNRNCDVVIVGGGASGLAAAVELGMSSPELDVLIIEKMDKPARKLRATGSGRCNITNTGAAAYDEIQEFFSRIGLLTYVNENGLAYPYSESASDVAELLIARAVRLGAKIACSESVTSVKCIDEAGGLKRFEIGSTYKDKDGEHTIFTKADYAILACGGKAGPMYGTTGDGYKLAKELGHRIVTPVPALTGIECVEWGDDAWEEPQAIALAGTRTDCEISLYAREDDIKHGTMYEAPYFHGDYMELKPVFRERGELQFTKYGLSGICVFNMSRHMKYDKSAGGGLDDYFIKVNLFPDGPFEVAIENLMSGEFEDTPLEDMFCTIFKKPLADYLIEKLSVLHTEGTDRKDQYDSVDKFKKMPISNLGTKEIMSICELVHGLEFEPAKLRGWRDAQLTMGGVSMAEIDEITSESKKAPGLYIIGELADRDFPCGGFNLSNAWITGISAASHIAKIESDRV